MRDIPDFDTFVKVKLFIKAGRAIKSIMQKLLLRVSDILVHEAKQQEFDIMKKCQLLSWYDGEEAKAVLCLATLSSMYSVKKLSKACGALY